jgi:hypothetical protein
LGLTAKPKAIFSTGNVTITLSGDYDFIHLSLPNAVCCQLCLMAQQLKKHFQRPTGGGDPPPPEWTKTVDLRQSKYFLWSWFTVQPILFCLARAEPDIERYDPFAIALLARQRAGLGALPARKGRTHHARRPCPAQTPL